ncbi:hypothetical protein [Streptomyces sp. MMBL 11-1]|uniref:hypothetical protein n=1 Tax=Streptomyces sp. MMBL 11-1 TaxID=3026420 RepID=UPI0023608EDD|nr:hypothetical protein [Streptomyces sp. MMBL 11-1]
MNPDPQAAYYGLGAIFPVVVIDHRPIWHQPTARDLPAQRPQGPDVLALRWCGPAAPDIDTLRRTATDTPPITLESELPALKGALPAGVRLITIRPGALIGPWVQRPGRATRSF